MIRIITPGKKDFRMTFDKCGCIFEYNVADIDDCYIKCPTCGKTHRVTFFSRGLTLSPQFEENTCDGFKDLVNNLIRTEATRFINNPFPHLK